MIWKKPANLKYTQLCMYIDGNLEKIRNPGEYPEVEEKIYNYLWLLVKALAIKKCMFQNFEDYDPYSFYSANRLFFAFRRNLVNEGKIIKGKLIKPVKSSLNYTKMLLNPMKIEYQREAYREIIDEENISKKFDAVKFRSQLREEAKASQLGCDLFKDYLVESFLSLPKFISDILDKSPFAKNSTEYKNLKITLLLNSINSLNAKNKLQVNSGPIILWRLPKSMTGYVKILLTEFYSELKKEIVDCYASTTIDDDTADSIINYREGSDYNYGEQY